MPCGGKYAAGPRAAAEMSLPVPPSASTARRLASGAVGDRYKQFDAWQRPRCRNQLRQHGCAMNDSTYLGKQAPTLTMLYWRDGFTASPACLAVPQKAMSGYATGQMA
jgi:hypothetical protein